MTDNEKSNPPKRTFPIWSTLVVLSFVGLGLGYSLSSPGAAIEAEKAASADVHVSIGELYYVFVETAEFAPLSVEGEAWDLDDSAPDMAYTLSWKGQRVFESSEVQDSLIGRWSGMTIGVNQALSLVNAGKADPAQIIDAALVRAETGRAIDITFKDEDLSGHDSAGEFHIPFETLKVGETILKDAHPERGVVQATLRVVPSNSDLFKVIRGLTGKVP